MLLIKPLLTPVQRGAEDRDPVMRPVRRDPLSCAAIAMPGHEAVAVENVGDQIVAGDQHQLPIGRDDIGGGAVAVPAPPFGRPVLFGPPPIQWITRTTSEASSSISAITS